MNRIAGPDSFQVRVSMTENARYCFESSLEESDRSKRLVEAFLFNELQTYVERIWRKHFMWSEWKWEYYNLVPVCLSPTEDPAVYTAKLEIAWLGPLGTFAGWYDSKHGRIRNVL